MESNVKVKEVGKIFTIILLLKVMEEEVGKLLEIVILLVTLVFTNENFDTDYFVV